MLQSTMIHGFNGEDNIQRIRQLVRRSPILPLPGGGKALMQPIHTSDVVRSVLACLDNPNVTGPIIIAGRSALSYRDLVHAVAKTEGRRILIIPLPIPLLLALRHVLAMIRFGPRMSREEILRLQEDKCFDIGRMRAELGVNPLDFIEALQLSNEQEGIKYE